MSDAGWEGVNMTPELHEALTGLKATLDGAQPCGHPADAVAVTAEGTGYCWLCAAHAPPEIAIDLKEAVAEMKADEGAPDVFTFRNIAARNSGFAPAEIENDIEAATAETRQYGTRNIDLLMAYYNDPDTDFPDAGELPKFDLSRDDRHNESAVIVYIAAVVILLALAALWAALAWVGLSRCGAGLCL